MLYTRKNKLQIKLHL
jgi:hypothetical protein